MKNNLLNKALKIAKVTNELEHKTVKQEHIELVKMRLKKEITEEEFQRRVINCVTRSKR